MSVIDSKMRSICSAKKIKYSGGYTIPDKFSLKWILFQISESAIEEKYIKENYSRVEVMETLLMKQIQNLKQLE